MARSEKPTKDSDKPKREAKPRDDADVPEGENGAPVAAAAAAAVPESPLESSVEKMLELLDHKRGDRRMAAAILLGEIALMDGRVLDALRKAIKRHDDPVLRRYAAEAIGAIAPKTIVQDLRPLIRDPESDVRDAVKRVFAAGRGVTLEDIREMLATKDDKQRAAAIAVLGAMATPPARRLLFELLEDESSRLVDLARDALHPMLSDAGGLDAMESVEELSSLADEKRLVKSANFALAVIDLLGHVPNENAADVLTQIASMGSLSIEVRSAATQTVRRVIQGKKPSQKVFRFLLEILEAGTPLGLLGPAADALTGLDVPIALEPRVRALTGSEQAPSRRWALKALGSLDTAPAAKAIARAIEVGDATDREVALEAALLTTNGKNALAKLLTTITEEDKARLVANALKAQANTLTSQALHALEGAVLEVPPAISQIIIDLLKSCGGQSSGKVHETLFENAMRAKKKGQFHDAAELFKRLSQGNVNDAEARFQQGVCELKLSRRVVQRGGKSSDPCITTFHGLIRVRDFPVIDRLKAEGLSADELYYLGFSLAEHSTAAQGMGGDILTIVSESDEDPKLKQMAHNKLVTMGFTE